MPDRLDIARKAYEQFNHDCVCFTVALEKLIPKGDERRSVLSAVEYCRMVAIRHILEGAPRPRLNEDGYPSRPVTRKKPSERNVKPVPKKKRYRSIPGTIKKFILEALADGPMLGSIIQHRAEKMGISYSALQKHARDLGIVRVVTQDEKGKNRMEWSLPNAEPSTETEK